MNDGASPRFDFAADVPALEDVAAVHLIAIGGSGMSGVARMFLARGIRVSGSDQKDSPTLRALEREGATVTVGNRADNVADLSDDTVVVISSAITETNPELVAARGRGLTVLHRAQALRMLSRTRQVLAVAGANGKTTTSAMATLALRELGRDPSWAIGADIVGMGANAAAGGGRAFVIEADESDGSFLVYRPSVAIVTNIKVDHLDFYGTPENLRRAYDRFAATIRDDGLLVACADDPGSASLATARRGQGLPVVSYGRSDGADLRIEDLRGSGFEWHATVIDPDGGRHDLALAVPGEHNLLDAAGVVLALHAGFGVPVRDAVTALAAFHGTTRRFEPRGEAGGVRVVDDYAHNPGKLAAVVSSGLRLREGGRLIVVFQPHLYSRTRDAAAGLAAALSKTDIAIVLPVFGAREDPMPGVTSALITDRVRGARCQLAEDHEDAVDRVVRLVRPGDLVLTVGAGDVTGLGPRILQRLAASTR